MEGFYPDVLDKIGLALAVGQSAKTEIVKEYGIGEELAMNILGWDQDRLICVAQMDVTWDSDEDEKISRTADACLVMRRGFHCDSFTLIAEGYISREPNETRDFDLAEEYANGMASVNQCLSINHIEDDNISLCAVPFRVAFGRDVQWGVIMHTEDASVLRNDGYLALTQRMLSIPKADLPTDKDAYYLAMAVGLHEGSGYYIQYDI